MDKTMILKPRMSEKAFGHSQALNTYVFVVPTDATKHTVARAVAAQYEVEVVHVNILNVKGKTKRTVARGGRRSIKGTQNAIRKAYVTLAEGNSLPVFDGMQEDATDAKETK